MSPLPVDFTVRNHERAQRVERVQLHVSLSLLFFPPPQRVESAFTSFVSTVADANARPAGKAAHVRDCPPESPLGSTSTRKATGGEKSILMGDVYGQDTQTVSWEDGKK